MTGVVFQYILNLSVFFAFSERPMPPRNDFTNQEIARIMDEIAGLLEGKRVVRGREAECGYYYRQTGELEG